MKDQIDHVRTLNLTNGLPKSSGRAVHPSNKQLVTCLIIIALIRELIW